MKNLLTLILSLSIVLTLFAGCSETTTETPPILEQDEIISMESDVSTENTETNITQKQSDMSDKVVEMEKVFLVDETISRDSFYGVPVKLNDKYYKIPALKILNYYFLETSFVSQITGINFTLMTDGIEVTVPTIEKFDLEKLEEGNLSAEPIDTDSVVLSADEENLIISYKNKTYIALLSIEPYMTNNKFYIDKSIGAITNKLPDINHKDINDDGLLRKSISIEETKELVVRESSYGKMIALYDVYGAYLDITPDNITYATDLQNIFFHKTEDVIYMFGLMGHSVDVYTVNIDEQKNISIVPIGSIQRPAQNIYYVNNTYIAVGRNNVFGINIGEDSINEINLKTSISMKETSGDFNIINGDYYLPVKNLNSEIVIYKLNFEAFRLDEVEKLSLPIMFDKVENNFYYSFVENNMISIYAKDNTGYIYNITYDIESKETKTYQTDVFRLFYTEKTFPVEFAINLVKANETGDSQLSLTINNKYLGNNIIVYGVEDNWVYCSEYIKENGNYKIYSFRYNAITGVKDYANFA